MVAPSSRQSVKQPLENSNMGGVTADGQMDHLNFAAKPVTATKKKAATKKNAFFSDSDSDEQDSKPVSVTKPQMLSPVEVVSLAAPA